MIKSFALFRLLAGLTELHLLSRERRSARGRAIGRRAAVQAAPFNAGRQDGAAIGASAEVAMRWSAR
jgi:hypothetical protein